MSIRKSSTIGELLKKQKTTHALPRHEKSCNPICVKKEDSLPIAFEKFIEYKIQAVPVVDDNRYAIGFIDLIDFLYYVLSKYDQVKNSNDSDMEFLRQEMFSCVTCEDIANFSNKNPFIVVTGETHLETTLEFMLESNAHRLSTLRPDGTLYGVLSQMDIMRWITESAKECDELLQLLKTEISDLDLYKQVITIQNTRSTREAFYKVREAGVSGVGVVNSKGELVGNISAIDILPIGLDSKLFNLLSLPLNMFMEYFLDQTTVISVKPNDTLEKVIEKLNSTGFHRIYILDNHSRLLGLISPIDIIKLLFKHKQHLTTSN